MHSHFESMSLFELLKKAVTTKYDKEIAKFQSMGFEADDAERYLKQYDGDMDLAMEVKYIVLILNFTYFALHNYQYVI